MKKARIVVQRKGNKYYMYPEAIPLRYRGKHVTGIQVLPEDLRDYERGTVQMGLEYPHSRVSPAVFSTRTVEELKDLLEKRRVFYCSKEEYQKAVEWEKGLQEEL